MIMIMCTDKTNKTCNYSCRYLLMRYLSKVLLCLNLNFIIFIAKTLDGQLKRSDATGRKSEARDQIKNRSDYSAKLLIIFFWRVLFTSILHLSLSLTQLVRAINYMSTHSLGHCINSYYKWIMCSLLFRDESIKGTRGNNCIFNASHCFGYIRIYEFVVWWRVADEQMCYDFWLIPVITGHLQLRLVNTFKQVHLAAKHFIM